jgi:hypothetical protein
MLLNEASIQNVEVHEKPLGRGTRGLYGDNVIWLNRGLPTYTEKVCVLAEEMGHYYTSTGDILNQKKITHIKQEKRARNWAYEKLIPLKSFVVASKEGISNRYELAEFLDVTEEFLEHAITHYKEKYGLYVEWTSYVIYFEPLGVLELFDE